VNKSIPYAIDDKIYGDDYWATPYETIAAGSGDCEDVAILKYFALRHLGVPHEAMRIAQVTNERGVAHSLLLAQGENQSKYFLNNDGGEPIKEAEYRWKITRGLYNFGASGWDMLKQTAEKDPTRRSREDAALAGVAFSAFLGGISAVIGAASTPAYAPRRGRRTVV
jgi:hypothetical protein